MGSIGILGGSFDPIHLGHLSIAETAMEELNFSGIVIMPTRVSPFKMGLKSAEGVHRFRMAELAVAKRKNFSVSDFEVFGSKVSYTYKTLTNFQKNHPSDELHFIMGTDSFLTMEKWYMGKSLLKEFPFVLATRSGYKEREVLDTLECYRNKYRGRIDVLHNKVMDISSTEIKKYIKAGKSIEKFVPHSVARYIYEHGLYK